MNAFLKISWQNLVKVKLDLALKGSIYWLIRLKNADKVDNEMSGETSFVTRSFIKDIIDNTRAA